MSANGNAPVLQVHRLAAGYEGVPVLHEVTVTVHSRECVGILGHNGAGKSTLLAAVMGLVPASAGTISLDGDDLVSLPPHEVARRGLGYVPQGRRLFPRLTVDENIRLAARERWSVQLADELYGFFPALADRRKQLAGTLSGGEQQMTAIARGLATDPKVLLLDEPSEGLAPVVIQELAETLDVIARRRSLGILLVEQNLDFAARVADRSLLIEKGRVVGEITGDELVENERAREFLSV